jgi:hypothetical protein
MAFIQLVKVGDTKPIDTTSGTPMEFPLSSLKGKYGSKFAHILGFAFKNQMSILQSAAGIGIASLDYPRIYSQVQFSRRSNLTRYTLTGQASQTFEAIKSFGVPGGWLDPVSLPASGGALTTAKTWWHVVMFDSPYRRGRYDHVWPSQAWKSGNALLNWNTPAFAWGSANFAWGAGVNQVTLYAIVMLKDEPTFGADAEVVAISKATTTSDSILLKKGVYGSLTYAPGAVSSSQVNDANAGGDNAAGKVTSFDTRESLPNFINLQFGPSDYNRRWLMRSRNPFSRDALNLVTNGRVVVLWAPGYDGKLTEEAVVIPEDVSCDVVLSSGLNERHYFIAERYYPRDLGEVAECLQGLGITDNRVLHPDNAGGGPIAKHRTIYASATAQPVSTAATAAAKVK